jgi:hypothetical protein
MITNLYITQSIRIMTKYNNFRLIRINVIERKYSDCKCVEIFTHRVGSIGASRTVFIRGTNTKQ